MKNLNSSFFAVRWRPSWARIKSFHPLTCSLEVEPDLAEAPHHVFELQQERKQTVVLVHAAVGDDDVQRPVHLGDDTKEKRQRHQGEGKKVYKGVRARECGKKQQRKVEQELGKKQVAVRQGERRGGEMCEYRDVDKGGERIVKGRWSVRDGG